MDDDYDKQKDIEAEGQRAAIYHRPTDTPEIAGAKRRLEDQATSPSVPNWARQLLDYIASQESERASLLARYEELIYAVASKWPKESRHQTALRYIRRAEEGLGDLSGGWEAKQQPHTKVTSVANCPYTEVACVDPAGCKAAGRCIGEPGL